MYLHMGVAVVNNSFQFVQENSQARVIYHRKWGRSVLLLILAPTTRVTHLVHEINQREEHGDDNAPDDDG